MIAHAVRSTRILFELYLRLSRACLGKPITLDRNVVRQNNLSFLRSRLIAVTRNPDHASRWHQRRARRRQRLPLDTVVLRARLPSLVAAVSAGDGRLRTVVRGLHALAVLHKTPTFGSFPYVCPEHVLVQ